MFVTISLKIIKQTLKKMTLKNQTVLLKFSIIFGGGFSELEDPISRYFFEENLFKGVSQNT
ncbi:hypothetical protein DPV73_14090 [Leptospira mayottensis]|nr:hypothetical protein DPV73_14090 [Leptospira mayottensis]